MEERAPWGFWWRRTRRPSRENRHSWRTNGLFEPGTWSWEHCVCVAFGHATSTRCSVDARGKGQPDPTMSGPINLHDWVCSNSGTTILSFTFSHKISMVSFLYRFRLKNVIFFFKSGWLPETRYFSMIQFCQSKKSSFNKKHRVFNTPWNSFWSIYSIS